MEGILLMPPERGPILGRPIWKPRYVVIGPLSQKEGQQSNNTLSHVLSTARISQAGGRSSRSLQKVPTDMTYFSVYKSKDDTEPIIQHSINSITACQIQRLAQRKQSNPLPTLTIQITPDPATDKLRKRRSSRTTGLIPARESGPMVLCFVAPDDSQYAIEDWSRYIQFITQQSQSTPMSPISPTSPAFVSPFPLLHDAPEQPTATSGTTKGKLMSKLQPRSSGRSVPSSRDHNSAYISGSPSLRSRTSDLSSHASVMIPAAMNFVQQHYASLQHSELPSPASTVDEYSESAVDRWAMAQARSSAMSSPIRGRASTGSSHDPSQPSLESSPRLTPRETILDRAFQMRCIPGSDREVAGEEKLTSLARFEALMCEVESRRKRDTRSTMATIEPLQSTWEHDESDEDGVGKEADDVGDDDDSDNYAFEHDTGSDDMDPSTFKALKFITNRHHSAYVEPGSEGTSSVLRPHTAHTAQMRAARPTAQRTSSQPYITGVALHGIAPPTRADTVPMWRSHEKRHSTSEMKNLSFNEFAKRLSGTSSLLLVQSNTSTGSNRGSGDYDSQHTPRGSISLVSGQTAEERCRWRGSIGVFGNEGGLI